jgi:D-beta-D-heptose 7-phosphate kinase/D-beta-D-heptose 1-phosphate adenosyltransferase
MRKKIQPLKKLIKIREELKPQGKTVVFTNGCFDLLHRGHIHLFREAKKLGDVLLVAVNDDASVKEIKGAFRPVFPLAERLEVLEAVEDIDYLTSFSEQTPQKIIASLLPDVLAKGGDWSPEEIVGRSEVEEAGGEVVVIPYLKGYSSSAVIEKILDSERDRKE